MAHFPSPHPKPGGPPFLPRGPASQPGPLCPFPPRWPSQRCMSPRPVPTLSAHPARCASRRSPGPPAPPASARVPAVAPGPAVSVPRRSSVAPQTAHARSETDSPSPPAASSSPLPPRAHRPRRDPGRDLRRSPTIPRSQISGPSLNRPANPLSPHPLISAAPSPSRGRRSASLAQELCATTNPPFRCVPSRQDTRTRCASTSRTSPCHLIGN